MVWLDRWHSGDNQSVGSSAPVVSRWLWPGSRSFLEMNSMVVTYWIVFFVPVIHLSGPFAHEQMESNAHISTNWEKLAGSKMGWLDLLHKTCDRCCACKYCSKNQFRPAFCVIKLLLQIFQCINFTGASNESRAPDGGLELLATLLTHLSWKNLLSGFGNNIQYGITFQLFEKGKMGGRRGWKGEKRGGIICDSNAVTVNCLWPKFVSLMFLFHEISSRIELSKPTVLKASPKLVWISRASCVHSIGFLLISAKEIMFSVASFVCVFGCLSVGLLAT